MAILLLYTVRLSAQSPRIITGKISDEKGDPVFGASVLIKGTRTGTTTGNTGEFRISVPASARALVVTAISFAPMEVALGEQNEYSINLKEDNKNLEEVVITGYGREKRTQFVGAATRMSSKVVETVPVGAFDQALQGRAPGLLVNSSSGQPGTSANVIIRGVQSIQGAGAQPLYIIDGIPLPASEMQTINPNDFESITILKDASAAALYGARGGIGVIVITTKKGKMGATNIMYRTQFGFTQAPNSTNFDMMNTTEILQYEERIKLSGTPGWDYSRTNPSYATQTPAVQARRDFLLDSIGKINTNYGKLLFRQGISQLHELNMSGGSDKTKFFISAAYFDQKGTDLNSRLKRYTTRFNIEHTANKLTVQFNTLAGFSRLNFSEGEWLGNSARNSFQMSWRAKPYENPYKPDGTLNYGSNTTLALKQIANVLEGIENSVLTVNQIKINSGLTLAYKLLPSVTVRNTLGVDVSDDRWQRWIRPDSYIGSLQTFQAGINSEANRISSQIINTTSAIFSKKLNDLHEVEVGGYFEVVRGYQKALGLTLYNLDSRLDQTGQGAGSLPISTGQTTYPQNSGSAKSGFGIRSYFATARYTYNNKYTIAGNVRRDGTSRIANEANKEINTWSAGAIWNAIEENFLKTQNIFSDIRVRVSYGQVPNIGSIATGNYTLNGFGAAFLAVTNYQSSQIPAFGTTSYAGSSITGLVPTTPGNPNYKIETIKKLNIGVDLAAFNNRARLTVDVYRNKTVDLFVRQPLPAESGFANLDINAGIMTNKGAEFSLSVDIIKQKQIDLTLGVNHAINKNNIEDLGLVNEYFSGTFVIREGLPYGSHYTYHYLGADAATGRPRYETADGKETTDIGQAGQFAKFGTYLPKHYGGFTADFRFGNLTISALFSYQFDVVRSNNIESWVTRGTPGYHTSLNASRRLLTQQWQKTGDVAYYQAPGYDRGFTSADLQDAKFIRFRNLNVAYQIPEIAIKGTRIIKGAKFYVQAQNIYVWSTWRGPDPEDGNNISLNEFPNPRMIVTGLDINF
jgi:TonB-linked SusC/RagA family outer membrane protein